MMCYLTEARIFMKKLAINCLFAAIIGFVVIPATAADAPIPVVKSESAAWIVSNTMPLGTEYQLIYEDPKSHGVEVLVRLASGEKVPSHYHSADEAVFMVSGSMLLTVAGKASLLKP